MEQLLKIDEVARLIGRGTTAIYAGVKAGNFPPPVRIGGVVRWRETALEAWLESLPVGIRSCSTARAVSERRRKRADTAADAPGER